MNKITQMLKLQQRLNDETNGIGWEEGLTRSGKIIDWRRCSYLECAELIESYPWKHWKDIDSSADYDNIKIEAVDIWHFIMSQALKEYKQKELGDIEALSQMIQSTPNYNSFTKPSTPTTRNYYEQIEIVEELMSILFARGSIESLVEAFIEVAMESNLNIDTLYQLYIGKNILNKFRQEHGYKDGSYIKIWSGQEDNVVMKRILDTKADITPDELYQELSSAYGAN
jgi:dimeric dUTPase (all-alpha-NTP-PPase superfamily)